MKPDRILKLLKHLAKKENADIYVFNASMDRTKVDRFRDILCGKTQRRENALLFLTTLGGDPDAAYRLAACLQRNYKKTIAYIFGRCKSAGTLAVIGANSVVMGDYGELGPLDVQLIKPDEIIPTSSGLDIFQALAVIKNSAFETFEEYLLVLVERSGGSISAKTAAEIARGLTVGLYGPMTEQIDPERLGEVQRAINIANAYGQKLDKGNLKKGALEKLVQGYPTHGFVIDIDEAKNIFTKVRNTDKLEASIGRELSSIVRRPSEKPIIIDLFEFLMPVPVRRTPHAAKPKAKSASRSISSGTGGDTGNVAQLRRDAASHSASTEKDDDTTHRPGRRKTNEKR